MCKPYTDSRVLQKVLIIRYDRGNKQGKCDGSSKQEIWERIWDHFVHVGTSCKLPSKCDSSDYRLTIVSSENRGSNNCNCDENECCSLNKGCVFSVS